jgi:hypothetical protein
MVFRVAGFGLMDKKHFSEEQIAFLLRQYDANTSATQIIRKLGVGEQTFFPAIGRSLRFWKLRTVVR